MRDNLPSHATDRAYNAFKRLVQSLDQIKTLITLSGTTIFEQQDVHEIWSIILNKIAQENLYNIKNEPLNSLYTFVYNRELDCDSAINCLVENFKNSDEMLLLSIPEGNNFTLVDCLEEYVQKVG